MTKVCNICLVAKPFVNFYNRASSPDGIRKECKVCFLAREKTRKATPAYKNRKSLYDLQRRQDPVIGEIRRAKKRKAYHDNPEKAALQSAKVAQKKKDDPVYSYKLTEYFYLYNRRPEIRKRRNARNAERRRSDPSYRLSGRLRTRIRQAVLGNYRGGSAVRDLGCSIPTLKTRFESLFQPGMTWENWGYGKDKWTVDHIMPLCAFRLEDRQHFLLANHYLNLQPMWFEENIRKNGKLPIYTEENNVN